MGVKMVKPQNKFRNYKIEKKGKVYGAPLVGITFRGNFTLGDIRKAVSLFGKKLADATGSKQNLVSINALVPHVAPVKDITEPFLKGKEGKWFNILPFRTIPRNTQDLKFNIDNYEKLSEDYFDKLKIRIPERFRAFQILFIEGVGNKKVGDSAHNDCLYHCLKDKIPDFVRVYPTPEDFKKSLGLKRNDPVPIKYLARVEKQFPNYGITVYGPCPYYSRNNVHPKNFNRLVYLFSTEDHVYIPTRCVKLDCFKGISDKEKKPIVFKTLQDDPQSICVYDGEKTFKQPFKVYQNHRSRPFSSPYLYIKCGQGADLKEVYDSFVKDAQFIKEKSGGKYNLFKTGKEIKCVLQRFQELNEDLCPEPINDDEAMWIDKASFSALIWAENGYQGEGHEYDYCSKYASILADPDFSFPIGRGVFKVVSPEEFNRKAPEYGIYMVKIEESAEITGVNKHFRFNKRCLYTHYDIIRARELGLSVSLITEPDLPNALVYPERTRANGNECFGTMIRELFELKRKYGGQCKRIKVLTLCIWGALSEKVKFRGIYKNKGFEFDQKSYYTGTPMKLLKILDLGKDPFQPEHVYIMTEHPIPVYNCDFARLAPFILAKGRADLSRLIGSHAKDIVRVHTDGFISRRKLDLSSDPVTLGDDLGNLKYKGYCKNLLIRNAITVIDTETQGKYSESLLS